MALTYTPAGSLGAACPDFRLPSVDGREWSLGDFAAAKALVMMFICNHCPYVRAIEDRLIALAGAYVPRGVAFVGVCANDPAEYPEDAPDRLRERWLQKNYGFPYLIDREQDVARAFGAVCTPDLFVYDQARTLAYRGRLDDSWRDPARVRERELQGALDALLAGARPASEQNPAMGCSIKWKNP